MDNIGIIDIGSNTIHLIIVKIDNMKHTSIIDQDKEHLRLGANMHDTKDISFEKLESMVVILKRYLRLCILYNVRTVITVATEALRIAKNNDFVLSYIKKYTGINIKILSKKEEAYLAYLGVSTVCPIDDGLIVDCGGNSTELIRVRCNTFVDYVSLPLGAINITEQIQVNDKGAFSCCYEYDETYFNNLFSSIPFINSIKNTSLIGIGGTFKNLKRVYNYFCCSPCPNNILSINPELLNALCSRVSSSSINERQLLKGLSKKRCDIILGGCYFITSLMKFCNFNQVTLCDEGLRSGILSNYINPQVIIS